MNLLKFSHCAVALCALIAARPARAHFIWAEVTLDTPPIAKLAFSDAPGQVSEPDTVQRIESARAWNLDGKVLSLKTAHDVRSGSTEGSRVFGTEQFYGVLDKTKEGRGVFKCMYYAKAALSLDDANHNVKLPFEMFARRDGADHINVTVKRGATRYEKASLNVYDPGEEKPRALVTDARGEIRFVAKPGLYGVKAAWVDETPGEIEDKKYPFIRNYSTLTFRVVESTLR
jgi:hypothetical protein